MIDRLVVICNWFFGVLLVLTFGTCAWFVPEMDRASAAGRAAEYEACITHESCTLTSRQHAWLNKHYKRVASEN